GRRATETSPHGVYWVRAVEGARSPGAGRVLVENGLNPRARGQVARTEAVLETELLHPLLRGQGIRPFQATPEACWLIFPHAEGAKAMPPEAVPPLTLQYLERYRSALEARGSYKEYRSGEPFYGLWRVGPYTFSPYKVVWPEMGELRAAVISRTNTPWGERMLVPEGKVNLIGLEREAEAHYLCALLNAPWIRRAYARMSSQIGRPSRLPFRLPPFDEGSFTHRALAAVSRAAHGQPETADRFDRLLNWLLERAMR
ncbi:MAG: hypothetical protein ACLGIN_18755, partial [Candidatus Sericytochromatia bacterium]